MAKLVYYVATSLDGFISGPEGDISLFSHDEDVVKHYRDDLNSFSTTIMGKHTYEFGYAFGLKPGQPAYAHMQHHIFSRELKFENPSPQVHVEPLEVARVIEIRDTSATDVYVCGGGTFAGWLLDNDLIDILKIKLNPITLGTGIQLFGNTNTQKKWRLIETKPFASGLLFLTYEKVSAVNG